jgi:hypothetical protein
MTWQPTYMEYLVLEVKDSLFRGKQSAETLQGILNQQAQSGWKYKSMMTTDLKGRMGVGSTDGMLLTFEREIPPQQS